jgi:putative ABC transport system permease protein
VLALEGALIGIPAAAIAFAATAALFPADISATSIVLAAVFALAPAALLAAFTAAPTGRGIRSDLAVRSRSRVRWVAEAAVLGLTVLAVVALFRRGFATAAASVGVDPLLAAVPLLLAVSGCILSLRLYPAVLALVHRLARRRRGPVALLGAARAVRTPALGFATGFALLVGVSISVFSAGISSTIAAGLALAAAEAEDADAVRALADEPVLVGLRLLLVLAAAGATLLAALGVILGGVAASEARNRVVGIARVLGFDRRQLGSLLAWELAPLAIVAMLVGTLVGAGELYVVSGALDLRPFLGTEQATGPVLDPVAVAGALLAFAVVVVGAGIAAAAIARRVHPVSSIKIGAE